jgi:hypothetical protein
MKACYSAAKDEGEEYGHCTSEKSAAAMVSAKKACCSEKKSGCADSRKE